MKVVQINAVIEKGSTGKIVADISDMLNKSDIENYVFYADGETDRKNAIKISNKFDRKIHAFLSRLTGKQACFSKRATKKTLKKLDEIKPDVVHLHNLHHNYINLKMLLDYLAKKEIKTVLTLHDCWFFTGKCTHYANIGCDKWQKECGKCPQLKKDNKSWFFDRTYKRLKSNTESFAKISDLAVIGVSDWITNESKKSILKNAKIIRRIYNWIDTATFYPRTGDIRGKYNLPKNKFLIFFASAYWEKDSDKLNDLLEISNKLTENEHVVVIGNIPKDVSLPKNVTCLGYVNDTDIVAEINSSCDVYVHVSRSDTFGKVIAEALACGTPAVVYKVTACPELIGENCGCIVNKGDVKSLFEAIKEVQLNGKEKYSESCIEFVKKNFEKQKLLGDTLSFYKDLL